MYFLCQDKKGAEEVVAGNPFEEAERLILADLAKWRKGTFTVTRELYESDENLCQAIENAIWVSLFSIPHLVCSIGFIDIFVLFVCVV